MEPLAPRTFERIVIVGNGLIGGSIALAAADRLPRATVVTVDRGDDIGAAAEADLVIVATPITQILELLPVLAAIVSRTAVVTDTGSTKGAIVNAAPSAMRFIGGHPIAGAAASGVAAAHANLLTGRPWILTPSATAEPSDVAGLQHFVEALGARAQQLDPEEHDRLFAYLSHLPQLVVSALMDVVGSHVGAEGLALAGPGLRDTTRLASSPPGIWRDIVRTNDAQVRNALDGLISLLTTLRDDSTGEALTETFERAARFKGALAGEDVTDGKGKREKGKESE